MDTPKKQDVQGTSSMLKQLLQDEAYLKALEMMERIERNAYKNGCYGSDE
jgi:hypothetical protein